MSKTNSANIVESNPANYIVKDGDSVKIVPKSPMNMLLYDHGLDGLLRTGDNILVLTDDESGDTIHIIPSNGATEYRIMVNNRRIDSVFIGEHKKPQLVKALMNAYRNADTDGIDTAKLLSFYEQKRGNDIRREILSYLKSIPPFKGRVSDANDGWLIQDYLLLTTDCEFFHPRTTSHELRGSVIPSGASEKAYNLRMNGMRDGRKRTIPINGEDVRLTNAELDFIQRAIWAIQNAPQNV